MSSAPASSDPRGLILARIREARLAAGEPPAAPLPSNGGRDALPEVPTDVRARIGAFAERMEELCVSFVLCDDRADVADGIGLLSKRAGWKSVAALQSPLLTELLKGYSGGVIWSGRDCDVARLASVDVAIVEADALEAQSGSILCGTEPGGLEIVSLPPSLIVVAVMSRLHRSLAEAMYTLAARNGGRLPAGFTVLTGGAFTQAVERRRVAKGFGPQSITVFLAPG